MCMIKELHNKVRMTLWEKDMPLYHINRKWKIQPDRLDVASFLFVALGSNTHTLARSLYEEDQILLIDLLESPSSCSS